MTDYAELEKELQSLIRGVPHLIADLANASALLWRALDRINWVGFYICDGETLILGPFQGKPACIEIPFGKGVCGKAAQTGSTQLVPDVHRFPGHIACDESTNSEIVVPIRDGERIVAVLDIDSVIPARFTEEDRAGLEAVASLMERELTGLWQTKKCQTADNG
ncbi:MAG: GAF domain-containing protein [Clostridia bacterium]|nr:GAF domain-containing protein [Clostridia bacterium]